MINSVEYIWPSDESNQVLSEVQEVEYQFVYRYQITALVGVTANSLTEARKKALKEIASQIRTQVEDYDNVDPNLLILLSIQLITKTSNGGVNY